MVDPGLLLHGHLGEDVAGEERLGEALGLVLVLPHALDEREVVLELLRGHERREFFLTARAGVAEIGRAHV